MKRIILAIFVISCCVLRVHALDLTAVGSAVGIRIDEGAVTVTGFSDGGTAEAAGIRAGDVITAGAGCAVARAEDIAPLLGGDPVRVAVERGGKSGEFLVTPVPRGDGWMLGIKVRDSISGIGTVTYYDRESGGFGALGHGVCAEDGSLLAMRGGEVVEARIADAVRGRRGCAGQLVGEFGGTTLGSVERNTNCGIFGHMPSGLDLGASYPAASRGEISVGAVTLLANVSGQEVCAYEAEILKIYPSEPQRNLLLSITDERLLAATGGILQGMSGSPIIQNGKLVGAVTHVLVNDPTKGYGIFIENMLDAAA